MVIIQVRSWLEQCRWLVRKRPQVLLLAVLLFSFTTRVWRLNLPETYVFDEVYHAVTAKLIARNDPAAFEWWHEPPEPNTAIDWLHPPLAKYTQAAAMRTFGETAFAWRVSSAVFGVGVIYLIYVLAKSLFADEATALLAAALASLDGLLLVQSRIAMNDIHVTFFILATLVCYQRFRVSNTNNRRWLLATGVAAGLALGSKWSGVMVIATLGVAELSRFYLEWKPPVTTTKVWYWLRQACRDLLAFLIIPAGLYLLSYGQMFMQGKGWEHLYKLHQQIWWYQTSLTATHGYSSRPWQWFLDLRPVWYWVGYTQPNQIANIYAFGNPILFWFGALAVIITVLVFGLVSLERAKLLKLRKKLSLVVEFRSNYASWLLLITAYFMVWLPWQFSPRIMFFYHYTPAVALLAIILARVLKTVSSTRRLGVLVLTALFFLIWFPLWTGLTVPTWFADNVYFGIIKSWK